jgi:hypothetical protein
MQEIAFSEVLDFKISRGKTPLQVRDLVHQSTKPLDSPLFKTLFFYKTCDSHDVSQDGNLQQVLRMKKKRFLKSFTYKICCKSKGSVHMF